MAKKNLSAFNAEKWKKYWSDTLKSQHVAYKMKENTHRKY